MLLNKIIVLRVNVMLRAKLLVLNLLTTGRKHDLQVRLLTQFSITDEDEDGSDVESVVVRTPVIESKDNFIG